LAFCHDLFLQSNSLPLTGNYLLPQPSLTSGPLFVSHKDITRTLLSLGHRCTRSGPRIHSTFQFTLFQTIDCRRLIIPHSGSHIYRALRRSSFCPPNHLPKGRTNPPSASNHIHRANEEAAKMVCKLIDFSFSIIVHPSSHERLFGRVH
jgi:hypothetical protein